MRFLYWCNETEKYAKSETARLNAKRCRAQKAEADFANKYTVL